MFRYQETHNWKSLSYQLLHLHGGWLAEPKVTVIPDAAGAARGHQGQIQVGPDPWFGLHDVGDGVDAVHGRGQDPLVAAQVGRLDGRRVHPVEARQ